MIWIEKIRKKILVFSFKTLYYDKNDIYFKKMLTTEYKIGILC